MESKYWAVVDKTDYKIATDMYCCSPYSCIFTDKLTAMSIRDSKNRYLTPNFVVVPVDIMAKFETIEKREL